MKIESGNLYHVFNRGNNRSNLFFNRSHYLKFLLKIEKIIITHCDILAYCLMPSHFHLLILAGEYEESQGFHPFFSNGEIYHPLVRKLGTLQSSYARALNKEFGDTGTRFQQKVKVKLVEDENDYPLTCFHYIHHNPVKDGIVKSLSDWEFSSFRDYANLRESYLVNKNLAYAYLGVPKDPGKFILESGNLVNIGRPIQVF